MAIARIQTIPRVKVIGELVQQIKTNTVQKSFKGIEGITEFTQDSSQLVHRYRYGVLYINDKISMTALRDMLDMKMLSEFPSRVISKMRNCDIRKMAMKWFGGNKKDNNEATSSEETDQSETNEASSSSNFFNQFVRIFESKELDQDQIDNRSQFSDFSLRLTRSRAMSEDFFDF